MITPRHYQADSVYKLIPEAFREGHTSVIRYAPMRSGKSIEQSLMALKAYEKGNRVILLTHRSKIFTSTLKHIGNAGVPCVDFTAGSKVPLGDWKCMLAMERSLWNAITRDPDSLLQPNILIIDEVHLKNFIKIIDFFNARAKERGVKLFVVGFSGTPKGKHLFKYFSKIIINVDSEDLIASKDLVPCKAYQMQDEDVDKIKKEKGEFSTKEMFKHYDKPKRYEGLIKEYNDKVKGLKGIVFCVDIEHTVKTYEAFKAAGVNAFMCHSGNKLYPMKEAESDRMIEAFEASSDGVMINQGKLDTGYDHPPMQWVAVDRATTSLQLWLQMASRAATPYPGKDRYVLLDFGMNHSRHGLVHQPRKWELKDPKKESKQQAAPVRICEGCSAMLYASARVCTFCGLELPKLSHIILNGVMVDVDTLTPLGITGKKISELTIKELSDCQKSGRLKATYVWRVLRTKEKKAIEAGLPDKFLSPYADIMDYSFGWVANHLHQMDEDGLTGYQDYVIR